MLKQVIEKLILLLFSFAMMITIFGSIRSSILFNENIKANSLIILLAVFFFISCYLVFNNLRASIMEFGNYLLRLFWKLRKQITVVAFLLIIFLQIFILLNVSTRIGWDVGAIFDGVKNMPNNDLINSYLSPNPNNSMFFYIMYLYSKVLGLFVSNPVNWLYWQIFNVLVLDFGFFMLFKASKKIFSEKVAYIAFYICVLSLSLSPWILVPYTDTFSFSLVSLIFYVYGIERHSFRKFSKYLLTTLLGVLLGIAFLLKPSSIIFFIAWIVMEFVDITVGQRSQSLFKIKKIIYVLVFLLATITVFNVFQKSQTMIEINDQESKPATHFIMMGLKNEGGYNQEDVDKVKNISGKENKKLYIQSEIRTRLKEMGPFGYLKFLMKKHFNNTSNGDFGWGRDGTPQRPEKEATSNFQTLLRDWYYQQGNRVNNLRFFMHLIWLIVLIFAFSVVFMKLNGNDSSQLIYILMLSILGGFIYLLLFEGGRSRYLIQFLPIFYMLAGIGLNNILEPANQLKRYIKK